LGQEMKKYLIEERAARILKEMTCSAWGDWREGKKTEEEDSLNLCKQFSRTSTATRSETSEALSFSEKGSIPLTKEWQNSPRGHAKKKVIGNELDPGIGNSEKSQNKNSHRRSVRRREYTRATHFRHLEGVSDRERWPERQVLIKGGKFQSSETGTGERQAGNARYWEAMSPGGRGC